MTMQDIAVYIIIALAAIAIAIRIYKQLHAKNSACSCGECEHCHKAEGCEKSCK